MEQYSKQTDSDQDHDNLVFDLSSDPLPFNFPRGNTSIGQQTFGNPLSLAMGGSNFLEAATDFGFPTSFDEPILNHTSAEEPPPAQDNDFFTGSNVKKQKNLRNLNKRSGAPIEMIGKMEKSKSESKTSSLRTKSKV